MLNVSTFPCPSCHEFINDSMTKCKYCSVPIDPEAASAAVELQDKVNRACNDASLVRNLAGAMWVFFLVRFIPIIGYLALVGMILLFLLIPVRLIMWLVRFGGIQTADLDYKRAKRNILVALGLWLLIIIVPIVLGLLAGAFVIFGNRT
jgi:hypothetical protein